MAVKEKDLPQVTSLGASDYIRAVSSAGASELIEVGNLRAGGVFANTTAPTADNTDGWKFVLLSSEPGTKYNGWIYLIEEQ